MSASPAASSRIGDGRGLGAAYVGLSAVDTLLAGSCSPTARRLRRVTKPLLMPTLGAAFATRTGARGPRGDAAPAAVRSGALAAQALSWGGDVALLGSSRKAFLGGVASFLGAHVAYTATYLRASGGHGLLLTDRGPRIALATGAVLGTPVAFAAGRERRGLAAPVAVYAGALSTMVAASLALRGTVPDDAWRLLATGTALFMVSDGVLGLREFVLEEPGSWADRAVMATYTSAQGLIAAGVARTVADR